MSSTSQIKGKLRPTAQNDANHTPQTQASCTVPKLAIEGQELLKRTPLFPHLWLLTK